MWADETGPRLEALVTSAKALFFLLLVEIKHPLVGKLWSLQGKAFCVWLTITMLARAFRATASLPQKPSPLCTFMTISALALQPFLLQEAFISLEGSRSKSSK